MFGIVILYCILLSSLISALCFFRAVQKNTQTKAGHFFASLTFYLTLSSTVYLYYLIFNDDFNFDYVRNHSSLTLTKVYKISVLWAGEEGSFLLWLLLHTLLLFVLLHTKKLFPLKIAMNNSLLGIFQILTLGFCVMLLVKNPFLFTEGIFLDGKGLNPLLEDPFMALHPPLIFIGYAVFAVPYSYAIASLITKNEYTAWISPAIFFTNIGIAFLGAGIFLGSFWAYKVLGWGGYWGFDPVENSSLVPFLLAVTNLHLLLLTKQRPPLLKATYSLLFLTFSSTLYGTFLTRSGFLGDFSVHSFGVSTMSLPLIIFMTGVFCLGVVSLVYRAKNFSQGEIYTNTKSKIFFNLVAMVTLVSIALLIFIGMSMPLLTLLLGKASAVDTDFYTRTLTPLGILLNILLFLTYYDKNTVQLKKFFYFISFLCGMIFIFYLGTKNITNIIFAGTSLMTLTLLLLKFLHKENFSAALVAHSALMLAFFSMVASSSADKTEDIILRPSEQKTCFSHHIQYAGVSYSENYREKYYNFLIDGKKITAVTKLDKNGSEVVRAPAIYRSLFFDLYLSPFLEEIHERKILLSLEKIYRDEEFFIKLLNIVDLQSENKILVHISLTHQEKTKNITLAFKTDGKEENFPFVSIFDDKYKLEILGISKNHQKVLLALQNKDAEQVLPIKVSVSKKPLMLVLFVSSILLVIACLIASKKYLKKSKN